ncbi:hypothetical protein [Streptomyces viridosporus]|uniref:hypothetical protein n=1 Tax=Streptomyces viridosporus TaxID=67581 RepID=UPI0036FAD7A4
MLFADRGQDRDEHRWLPRKRGIRPVVAEWATVRMSVRSGRIGSSAWLCVLFR